MEIRKKSDLYYASDEEIEAFFKGTVLRGQYSELPPKHEDKRFCGKIEHITINGMANDLCPNSLYVPVKFCHFVKPGLCEFYAIPNINALKEERRQYKLIITRIKNIEQAIVRRDKHAESKFRYNLKLKDDKFVGLFTENKDGSFTIRDIRRSDFSKLILQNGKEQAPIIYHPHLFKPKDGIYYEFSWILNGEKENYVYLFKVDETQSFQEVTPRNLIQRLHDDIMNYPAGAGQKIVKMLDTLKNQLTASGKEIFIYELLQNANDYPVTIDNVKQKVDVEFHLTLSSLVFMHSGAIFNEKNIAAICSINDKEKDTNKDAIGYKGIGFKTVFLDNENVYLQTGDYSFRFDRQATRDIVDTPWQILPIWTKYQELTPAERAIFTQAGEDFRVKFALKPTKIETLRESVYNYENMFRDIFKNERVILFIPNLSSVKVYLKGTPIPDIVCSRDNDTWRVDDFSENVDEEITRAINADIDDQEDTGGLKIPTKYYDFKNTKVSFACEIDGRKLKAVKDTCLYCYLPAKDATWGLKFLMNTDMIPNGARDDVEVDFDNSTNINETIANIAGSKLFEWILKLTKCGEYELDSIYNLIPNFASLKSGRLKYKELINSFEKGFVDRVETDDLVPTQEGYVCLQNVIVDETGLTSSGIMSDENFLKFTDNEGKYLPNLELRNSDSFESFAEQYLRKFNIEENIFDVDSLHEMISKNEFQEWLKVQDNNDKFLNFLLENELLEDFFDEPIFIEHEYGSLYSAEDLYYDIDEHLIDLGAFSSHICYISLNTREYFKDNSNWADVVDGKFNSFDPFSFVKDTLLSRKNKADTIKTLKDEDASIHFYHFIAKNNICDDEIAELPFFNTKEVAVENFEDKFIFFASTIGQRVCEAKWLDNIAIEFVSTKYDPIATEYFKNNLNIKTYSNEIIAKDIILSDECCNDIQKAIGEDYDISEDFVKFCFNNESFFTAGTLSNYALNVVDKDGDYCFIIPKDDEVFLPSNLYNSYSEKKWIDNEWMYCLDSDYIKSCSNNKVSEFKRFMDSAFWVNEISAKYFYKFVIKKHIKEINANISGNNDADGSKNIDFIKYLDDNYKLIFEEEKDSDQFASITLVAEDCYDIKKSQSSVYAFDDELKDILNKEWFPSGIAHMCTSKYGNSKAILAIKAEKYDFANFFSKVIVPNISDINNEIKDKEQSVDFHNLVIEHKGQTPANEIKEMKSAKLYLLGNTEPVNASTGHAILSSTAKELAENGLVEFSQLNIIDPAYNAEDNRDYWSTHLENSDFTITHFLKWLNDNTDVFAATIADETKNIAFWRWAKKNLSESAIANLPELPILLSDDTTAEICDVIYLADCYVEEGGVEGYVKKYDEEANFLSSKYMQEEDIVEEWQKFWTSVGIKSEIIDILIGTIIPKLNEIDEPTLPATLVKYHNELEKEYEDLPAALTNLRVKAHDGNFYSLKNCIYINCTEQDEPFAFVEIANQITFKTGEERSLIKQILDKLNVKYIDDTTSWRHAKINSYLQIQGDLTRREYFNTIHYAFMDELAELRETAVDALGEYNELDNILVLSEKEEYVDPKTLTMSSIYNPLCDFQKNGITSIKYTSDSYSTNCKNYVGKVMRSLGVHCDFKKGDIEHLTNREFAFYFWTKYLQSKADRDSLDKLAEYISSKEFSETACIPTKDYMRKPSSLYSPAISSYVKKTEDWENKLPLESISEIQYKDKTMFDLLPFKKGLSFSDCLYALLSVHGKDTRSILVRWAIEDYSPEDESKVDEYREDEDALWTNTKNIRVSIKSLYALEKDNATLGQYFNDLDRILNPEYMNSTDYTKACEIFKIKTITDADLIVDPNNAVSANNLKQRLRISALVMAGRYDIESWKDTYSRYDELIETMNLWRCTAISLQYKDDAEISQSLKKFYFKKETSEFFYVQDIDAKLVFNDFVAAFLGYLGVPSDFNKDIINQIMDSAQSALDMINNDLKLDEEFMNQLDAIIPGKKREMVGIKANDDDDLDNTKRHTYTAHTIYDDPSAKGNNGKEALDTGENTSTPPLTSTQIPKETDYDNPDDYLNKVEDQDEDFHADKSSNNYGIPRENQEARQSTPRQTKTPESFGTPTSNKHPNHYTSDHPKKEYPSAPRVEGSKRPYTDHTGWNDTRRPYRPLAPKPFSPEDVRNFGSNGQQRTLEILEPSQVEVDAINRLLDGDLSSEQVADQNYLAQYRLYQNLVKRGMKPDESEADFVRNAHLKSEHTLNGGKYIHKCSAAGGIMYISPSIWNKIADDRCVVCVYLGAKANEFMYFNSIEDILNWVSEDDIVIKLTGEEKADVVQELYSGILEGVKGTAYTMIRICSNEKYNSVFAPISHDPNANDNLTDDDI